MGQVRLRGPDPDPDLGKKLCCTIHSVCIHHTGYVLAALQDDLRGRGLKDSGERPYVMAKTYLLMANTRELARRLEGTGVDVIAGEAKCKG